MAAGGPAVSLVSRCSSVDEFLAAFRGYIHRDHVFVPTTGTIAAGRKGRIAITLADGTPVLAGEAEVLSSSQVPQGPYQKPGVRIKFTELDDAARDILGELDRAPSEPGLESGTDSSGHARADILAIDKGKDPSDAAMCSVVEASAPVSSLPATLPTRMVTPPAGIGSVPGKSFKIPSIPSIPSIPRRPATAAPASAATAVPRETSEGVSGDLTVPTDPPFREPSEPIEAPSIVVTTPPLPGGKARNKTLTPRRATPVSSPPPVRMQMPPIPVSTPPVVPPEPAPPPPPEPAPVPVHTGMGPPPNAGARYSKTLIGVPAIAITGATTRSAPIGGDDGWDAPEDGSVGDATERSITPAPELDAAVPASSPEATTAPVPEAWQAAPETIAPVDSPGVHTAAPAPPVLPPPKIATGAPAGKSGPVLRSGPSAPTMRTPQSMLELGAIPGSTARPDATPLPGMSVRAPTPPPIPDAAVPRSIERAEPTELVRRADGTDQLFVGMRRNRPVIIAIIATAVVSVVVVLALALSRGSDTKPNATGTGTAAATGTATASATGTASAAASAAAPDAGTVAVAVTAADAAPAPVAEIPADAAPAPAAEITPDAGAEEPTPTTPPTAPAAGTCAVTFTSSPSGAYVTIAGKRIGTTPFTGNVKCARATAVFARPRYSSVSKPFSGKEGAKVSAKLERPQFSLRVISSPGGATVTINGRSVGKTPANAKVDGFEATTIKVSKPGYQAKSTKVTAKKNGQVITVTLRRGN